MSTNVSTERRRVAAFAVGSYLCTCGERKKPMMSFCNNCWKRLPKASRAQLVRMVKGGFVLAFEEAQKFLKDNPPTEPSSSTADLVANLVAALVMARHGYIDGTATATVIDDTLALAGVEAVRS